MREEPVLYQEWREKVGETSWWEAPILVAMEAYEDVIKIGVEQIAKVLSYKLFETGSELKAPEVSSWLDIIRHRHIVNSDVKTVYECLPEQYLYMAYRNWLREYEARVNWESKSLWGYLRYWIKRMWLRIYRTFKGYIDKEGKNDISR